LYFSSSVLFQLMSRLLFIFFSKSCTLAFIVHNIWLLTKTAGDISLRPKEHRDLANANRVHPY
jgi:flagellar biogenesis protein FliO